MKQLFMLILSLVFFGGLLTSCEDESEIGENQANFFVKLYGTSQSQEAADLKEDEVNGGFVILGTTNTTENSSQILLIKTDEFGNELWSEEFGDTLEDVAGQIEVLDDGTYLMCGTRTIQEDSTDMWVALYNRETESLEFETILGGIQNQSGRALAVSSSGEFVVVGSTTAPIIKADAGDVLQNPAGVQDIIAIGFNSAGDSLWSSQYGGILSDFGTDVIAKGSGGYIIFGTTFSFLNPAVADFILVDITSTGDINGPAEFGSNDLSEISSRISRVDGDLVAMGTANDNSGNNSIRVMRFNGQNIASVDWDENIALTENGNSSGRSAAPNSLGGASIVGGTQTSDDARQTQFLEIDASGSYTDNNHLYGGGGNDIGEVIIQTGDGGYAILGTTDFEGNSMLKLIKLNASGTLE